ncbi:MAG: hypothetical protein V3U78_03090 [Thiotrichaceae bacterium]
MQLEDPKTLPKEDKDLPVLDLDDMEELDLSSDKEFESIEMKSGKGKNRIIRKSIEDILEERALRRQLSDVFDEDILLD